MRSGPPTPRFSGPAGLWDVMRTAYSLCPIVAEARRTRGLLRYKCLRSRLLHDGLNRVLELLLLFIRVEPHEPLDRFFGIHGAKLAADQLGGAVAQIVP